ncbi:amidase [Mesorhizobium sanjuanii]|uniref:Amidase n=1 Tax=Mesorhizobium sanjuanii TaxID=2037900 RepID=A0A2A6FL46_9HYPH|nr:amidase [Mesorhizobium sanjuanii]
MTAKDRLDAVLATLQRAGLDDKRVFTRVYFDMARLEAEAADMRAERGAVLGPLDGAIVSIKDLFDVKGEATLAGGLPFPETEPATSDAAAVAALRDAGAVIIGKTNMTEFAFSGLGLNPHYGTPANARDPERIPGGSSSGAALSVALGLADIAIGSDTGGSIRIPAALNGLVGFKPGQNRISRRGMYPLSFTLDCAGFIASDVDKIKAAYSALADDDALLEPTPLKPRFGVPRGFLFTEMDEHTRVAFEDTVTMLAGAGYAICDLDLDELLREPFRLQQKGTIVGAEAAFIHARHLDNPDRLDPFVLARIRRGQSLDAATYLAIQKERAALLPKLDAAMEGFDVLLLPTVPFIAPKFTDLQGMDNLDRANSLILRNTSVFNFFDLPALSLPTSPTRTPHPVGMMLVGRRFAEMTLISAASAVERTTRRKSN